MRLADVVVRRPLVAGNAIELLPGGVRAYPAMLASLATGNAVIVKPHPTAILPMALAVRTCRAVLSDAGFAPDLVTLCVDSVESPIGKILVDLGFVAMRDVLAALVSDEFKPGLIGNLPVPR